jgi:hypothetical protein
VSNMKKLTLVSIVPALTIRIRVLMPRKSRGDLPLSPRPSHAVLVMGEAYRRAAINTTSCIEKSFATSFSRGLGRSSCPMLFPATQILYRKYRSP